MKKAPPYPSETYSGQDKVLDDWNKVQFLISLSSVFIPKIPNNENESLWKNLYKTLSRLRE